MEKVTTRTTNEANKSAADTREAVIEMSHAKKSFGSKVVLEDVCMVLHRGENLVVLGKSGSGKSVNIKLITGMLVQDSGSVKVFGNEVKDLGEVELKALRIRIGFLFQSGALFDSMTVRQNMEFPLTRVLKLRDQAEIDQRVDEMLTSVGLLDAAAKTPSELSGGQRKRIGLARTLIMKPEIMLYDEPTTGLDPITSREISSLILEMQQKYQTSSVIITHDMACAKITADRIIVLNDGRFIAEGTYEELESSKDDLIQHFFK
ncbi:MAG: ATP-binding cassette domain-containing protein [Chitinophagaceae bacterium]